MSEELNNWSVCENKHTYTHLVSEVWCCKNTKIEAAVICSDGLFHKVILLTFGFG